MTTENTDIEAIEASPKTITIASGMEVEVQRLKLRQLLRLMKIITRGASPALSLLSDDLSEEEFTTSLLYAIALAIPDAEDETVDFLLSMVLPADFHKGRNLTKAQKAENDTLIDEIQEEFYNPELEDLVSLMEVIVVNEAPHIKALGNRIAVLLEAQVKSTTAKQSSASASTSKS